MGYKCIFVLVLGALAAGIASPQSIRSDLVTYLSLTDPQVRSIDGINTTFNRYVDNQERQYYGLQSQAEAELAKDSPDPGVVGSLYAQMEMISRDYNAQLAQVQSNVAAVLTPAQVTVVSALLAVARLQPLVSEAQSVDMEPPSAATIPDSLVGVFTISGILSAGSYSAGFSSLSQIPVALVNYFNLSDAQNVAIENAIQANQDYMNGQSLTIQELQYAIQALTAAQTIDTATLGADYVSIAQIQRDETTQASQLITTVRSVLTGQQQPLLAALDNAQAMSGTEYEAVQHNILVLPPDLGQTYSPFSYGDSLSATVY